MMYRDERILQNGLRFTECYTNNFTILDDLPGWGRQSTTFDATLILIY